MKPAAVRLARVVDVAAPAGGVVWVRLGDGAAVRATVALAGELASRPFDRRFVAYSLDAAGNRYDVRIPTEADFNGWRAEHRTPGDMADAVRELRGLNT